jgi:hypothetical protein
MPEQKATKYPYFGVPPARQPRPAAKEPALTGKRVVLSTPEGFVYDMRAASEIRTDGHGGAVLDIVAEATWFQGQESVRPGDIVTWPAHLVWVD